MWRSNKFSVYALYLMHLLWFIYCLFAFSNVGIEVSTLLVVMVWIICCGLFWFAWGIKQFFAWRTYEGKNVLSKWLLQAVIFSIPPFLSYLGAFSSLRFYLSEPELLNYVQEVRSGKINTSQEFGHEPRSIGLYEVTLTEQLADGTVRFITSADMMDNAGFAYTDGNRPQRQGEDSYTPMTSETDTGKTHWWLWHESW